ncbi:MAG TPA: hypothetical protein VLL52_19610 [Anaerolineae bacterium]|nr:hypothetical protein [Anaerolineae bacterium]
MSDYQSEQDNHLTEIEFINNLDEKVYIYWINYKGNEKHYKDLKPGKSYTVETYASHPWIIYDDDDKELGVIVATEVRQVVEINYHGLEIHDEILSLSDEHKVKIQFTNDTGRPIDIYWVDYEGEEEHFDSIDIDESYKVTTYATHPWVFRLKETNEVITFVVASIEKKQKYRIILFEEDDDDANKSAKDTPSKPKPSPMPKPAAITQPEPEPEPAPEPEPEPVYLDEPAVPRRPSVQLPEKCPRCMAPVLSDEVTWVDDTTATCSYCGGALRGE